MTSIYFHEDDFCQIEILPIENLAFCLKQANCIDEFAEAHKSELGYSDVYLREGASVSLQSKSLSTSTLQEALGRVLPKFDEVYTGYGTHREQCSSVSAFGQDSSVVIFHDSEEGVVKNIWLVLDVRNRTDITTATSVFAALSNFGDFLIADWGWGFVEPLRNTNSIVRYLEERLED